MVAYPFAIRDLDWTPGCHRDAPIIYIARRPEDEIEVLPGSDIGVPRDPPCPRCETGRLTLQPDAQGFCDLYTCTKGCSQRFGVEMD